MHHAPENTPAPHVAIIGSGAAAFACALQVADDGGRATLIERGTTGGTCVNVGCIPSKLLIRAAELTHHQRQPGIDGLASAELPVNRERLARTIGHRVDELRDAKYEDLVCDNPAIRLLQATATFRDAQSLTLQFADGRTEELTADRFLIATGATPAIPPIPGLAGTPYWTSTQALAADTAPEHLVVIGGSVVAVELAQAFSRLGSRVTLLIRSRLLSALPAELGSALGEALKAEGLDLRPGTVPATIEHRQGGFEIQLDDETLQADRLLIAAGRAADTGGLNLPAAGIAVDANGAIPVSDSLQTGVPHIYAAGDCTPLPQHVYVAAAAGRRAALHMLGRPAPLDLTVLPAVTFSDPQIATVGLDQACADDRGIRTRQRRLSLDQVPRALVNFQTRGFIQLLADERDGRLLGAQIVAPDAGETIQSAALAIRAGMTVDELAGELFPYLTWAEGLKLCAQTFRKDVSQLSCCAG